MKRDVADKTTQIANLHKKIADANEVMHLLHTLILDLERATGERFLAPELRTLDVSGPPTELLSTLRRALARLVVLHKDLPRRFEDAYAIKVQLLLQSIADAHGKIGQVREKQDSLVADGNRFQRLASVQRIERDSVESICNSLSVSEIESRRHRDIELCVVSEKISTVREELRKLRKIVKGKRSVLEKAQETFNSEAPKRVLHAAKEGIQLRKRIEMLERHMERETGERLLVEQELAHVREDVEGATAVVAKFKDVLSHSNQFAADAINEGLKLVIEKQREQFNREIARQKRRNAELERMRADLVEEEKMLLSYLQSVDKQLQFQLQKLPTLSMLQHQRQQSNIPTRSTPGKAKTLGSEDSEMRTIRRAMGLLQGTSNLRKGMVFSQTFASTV
jgi:hypothetical protein